MLVMGFRFMKIERNIAKANAIYDYNFYPIFKDEWHSSFAGVDGYCGILYYSWFKSLLSKLKAKKCLYCCEMFAWEMALISAKEAVQSNISIFSYQHSSISKLFLNYFVAPSQMHLGPSYNIKCPDKIICNGSITYDYMRESGWPQDRLLVAEAIRYNYLKKYVLQFVYICLKI